MEKKSIFLVVVVVFFKTTTKKWITFLSSINVVVVVGWSMSMIRIIFAQPFFLFASYYKFSHFSFLLALKLFRFSFLFCFISYQRPNPSNFSIRLVHLLFVAVLIYLLFLNFETFFFLLIKILCLFFLFVCSFACLNQKRERTRILAIKFHELIIMLIINIRMMMIILAKSASKQKKTDSLVARIHTRTQFIEQQNQSIIH